MDKLKYLKSTILIISHQYGFIRKKIRNNKPA